MIDLYYYSGRGNSLSAAKGIASRAGDVRLFRIGADALPKENQPEPENAFGLVFPVIDLGLPISVRRFIAAIPRAKTSPYAFAVATTGGMPAGILGQVRRLLARRGIRLSAAVQLPFSLKPGDPGLRDERISALCGAIRDRAPLAFDEGSPMERLLLTGAANFVARAIIPREDRKFAAADSCDGCGVCANLCPAANITMEAARPRWLGRCEQCGSCFAWCPKEAVSGSCLAAKTRYRNPEVTLEDMLARRSQGA